MLAFKRVSRTDTAETTAAHAPLANASLTPDRSDQELMDELDQLTGEHKKNRKRMIQVYIGGLALYALTWVGAAAAYLAGHGASIPGAFWISLVGSVVVMILGQWAALRVGQSFYNRSRERLQHVLSRVADRGIPNMLPQLLDLMDMRVSGVIMWKGSRPPLLRAMENLLARCTPDEFQEFAGKRMWEIVTMLYFPDGSLREVTADAAIRCGDSRTMTALKRLRSLSAFNLSAGKTPLMRWNPFVLLMKKQGVPLASEEGNAAIERAIAGLGARLSEERSDTELLRGAAADPGQRTEQLLRASRPEASVSSSEELVRPSSGDDLH